MKSTWTRMAILLALAGLLALPGGATAEEGRPGCPFPEMGPPGPAGQGGPPGHRWERLAEELGLTAEQQDQLQAVLAEELPAARERLDARIAEFLTPEQRAEFERLSAVRGAGGPGLLGPPRGDFHRGRPGPPAAEAQAARMAEQLSLTDEQQAAVRELLEQEMSATHQRIGQRIGELLTPDQRARWESLRPEEHPPAAGRSGQYPE